MYQPVQIPQILDASFSQSIAYLEDYDKRASRFAICFWEMQPINCCQTHADNTEQGGKSPIPHNQDYVGNVIVTDGCIDLVVGFDEQKIGFSGMSETVYDYRINANQRFMGVRLKPGAFAQLTGLSAPLAMNNYLPLKNFDPDFDEESFFALPFDSAVKAFKNYVCGLMSNEEPNEFVLLFDLLIEDIPTATSALYQKLHLSPRQCQRLFTKNFGYSPQKALSILRFQHCLDVLTSQDAKPSDLLTIAHYCDQSHCIKDFKKNIGLTPPELLARYS
jgi:AraC-like DNA-binding protein